MYAVDIDTLYALELELLRYPGLELEWIRDDGQIAVGEDETGDIVLDILAMNMLLFRFRGPVFGEMGKPAFLMPVSNEGVRDAVMRSFIIDDAVWAMESLVEKQLTG